MLTASARKAEWRGFHVPGPRPSLSGAGSTWTSLACSGRWHSPQTTDTRSRLPQVRWRKTTEGRPFGASQVLPHSIIAANTGKRASPLSVRRYSNRTGRSWQNLTTGAGYRSSYCMAVCPAGEDVIGPFLADRGSFLDGVLRPLRDKVEDVYVLLGGDAEARVARRFPHKRIRRVRAGLRPRTVKGFLEALPVLFQPGQAHGLDAIFHFSFVGDEQMEATAVVRDQRIDVKPGHVGASDLHVTADSATWLAILAKERNEVWALLRGKLRLRGPMRLMKSFAACFPL